MKKEFHGRRTGGIGFAGKSLMTLALVFSLIAAMPFMSNATEGNASGDSDSQTGSMTVSVANLDDFPELADAELIIDLYKVADVSLENDGYSYTKVSPYEGLNITGAMTGDDWYELSKEAARITLDPESGRSRLKETYTGYTLKKIGNLEPGLYLLAARSGGIEKYVTTTADGDIVTKASFGSNSYTFLPELVSLPTKEPDENGEVNTKNPGDWIYNLTVNLKPEKDNGYGSLIIGKILERYYVNAGPATFVFDVEAKLNGQKVYSNVVSIVFDDAGSKELRIDNIPAGADVTVTEVYSGACYTVKGSGTRTAVITADLDNPANVQFDNDYDNRRNGGSGITNHFKYDAGTNSWNWEQVRDTQG